LWVVLAGGMVAGGCDHTRAREPAAEGEVIARIGDRRITGDELQREISSRPTHVREQLRKPQARQALVEDMVRFEVLAAEATRLGYDKDPEVQRGFKQQMILQLVRKEVDEKNAQAIDDREIERYYRAHPHEFRTAERVRAMAVVVTDRAVADRVAREARAARKPDMTEDVNAFRALVARHSEDPATKARGGELGFLERVSTDHPRAVVDAVFALDPTGKAISDPVPVNGRHFVVKAVERRPGQETPLADASTAIRQRLLAERRQHRLDQLVNEAKARLKVEVDAAKVAALPVPPAVQPPAAPPR